jgi:hypothetical protein
MDMEGNSHGLIYEGLRKAMKPSVRIEVSRMRFESGFLEYEYEYKSGVLTT